MNNQVIRNQYDAFDRIAQFGTKHAGRFPAATRGGKLFADMAGVVSAMETNGVKKLTGTSGSQGGTNAKMVAAEWIREDLRAIRDTAVAIAEAEDTPDFDDQFRIPRSKSYDVLLAAARSFHTEAAKHKALFLEFAMPADFLEDLDEDIRRLMEADDKQDGGLSDQVAGTAELAAGAAKGMRIRKQLEGIVKNTFRNEPGVMAEWATAEHIVWPNRTKPADPATA